MNEQPGPVEKPELNSRHNFSNFTILILLVFLTAILTANFLPNWLPGLTISLRGESPKAYWYLSRGSAIIAYLFLWFSMILGTGITNKIGSLWPGLVSTIELHKFTSILGLAFGLFHGMILLGDSYIGFSLLQIFVPFSTSYQPLAVGLGQTAFYIWLILDISFYLRRKIGKKVWRAIHFASFLTYISVLIHALVAGTDASSNWMMYTYLVTGGLLVFMITYRILTSLMRTKSRKAQIQIPQN